jgi:predicted transcriptional regulator
MADTSKLKKAAKIMYVEQGKSQIEIHQVLGVSPQSITKWVNHPADNWKDQRTARMNTSEKRIADIKTVIGSLTERRIEITQEIITSRAEGMRKEAEILQVEAVAIGQEIAMYSKALVAMDKSNKPSLSMYLEIMDDIFKGMQKHDSALYLKTLSFQEKHLGEVTERLA